MRRLRGRLRGHLRAGRIAYLGHSFGGAEALHACRHDPRCAGAVDLDGAQYGSVLTSGPDAPLLWSLELDDIEHFDCTDYSAHYLALPLHLLLPVGSLPRDRALAVSDAYLAVFLRVAEGHAAPPLLAGSATPYPPAHLRRQR